MATLSELRREVIPLKELIIHRWSKNLAEMMDWMGITPGQSLYSQAFGPVTLIEVNKLQKFIKVSDESSNVYNFTLEGKLHEGGEVLLFPDEKKYWRRVPKLIKPPQKRIIIEQMNFLFGGIGNYIKILLNVSNEINDFYDDFINSSRQFPITERYTIEILNETSFSYGNKVRDESYYDIVKIEDISICAPFETATKNQIIPFPALFVFNSYSAVLYFLKLYHGNINRLISLINRPYLYGEKEIRLSHNIESDLKIMFDKTT